MLIDIVKHSKLFFDLEQYNYLIEQFTNKYTFSSTYDLVNNKISPWFDPKNIRNLGLSRTYPEMAACQYRREYCIYLHCSNYLPIFLINILYANRKNILIEDIGGGMAWFFLYLNKLGFNNFHLWDNFSQLSKHVVEDFIKTTNLNCAINDSSLSPVITNNVGVPGFVVRDVFPETELICCYTNRSLEKQSVEYFKEKGFSYLCKDIDDLSFVYCRNNKLEEFKGKLSEYTTV
jgi:hypothetical protein